MDNEAKREINELDVMLACCGVDENGVPNANVSVKITKINLETMEEDIQDEFILDTAVVNMHRNPKFTMVDLVYKKPSEFQFINAVGRLQKMVKDNDLATTEESELPTLVITIAPYKYIDEYFCTGMHGVWCVMPSYAAGPNNTLRFIFTNDCFGVYNVDQMADVFGDLSEGTDSE